MLSSVGSASCSTCVHKVENSGVVGTCNFVVPWFSGV